MSSTRSAGVGKVYPPNPKDSPPSITIDRTGLFQIAPHGHGPTAGKEQETEMARHIKALIQVYKQGWEFSADDRSIDN